MTTNANNTLGPEFSKFVRYFMAAVFGVKGLVTGHALAEIIYIGMVVYHNTEHIFNSIYNNYIIITHAAPPMTTEFAAGCGFAGGVLAVVGAIVGGIVGEKVGELATEYVLANNSFEGHEEVVGGSVGAITGGITGAITGGLAGAIVGGIIGFCIGGPAGALAFGFMGLKSGAEAGFFTGAINGLFSGFAKGKDIAKQRAKHLK